MNIAPLEFTPYNWLTDAKIFNQKHENVAPGWILENADIVALLFTAKGIDRDGIIQKFYEIYENVKYVNLPIEVIYVPQDLNEADAKASFEEQANWFTLEFGDPLVPTLTYLYGITCLPHIYVLKTDCSVISTHGILDLETYKKNAILTWLSSSSSTIGHRKMSKDVGMYGGQWKFMSRVKREFQRKFIVREEPPVML
ncbi:Uncharacterized protein OBRU01_16370 [Operophtera brumata]|uniref:Thioredoxin-like fold domain-containing protein n=1 Tax=Operophtera brumata TaxID=104452 RepID=A0A0L7L2S8_OPEBR|nr:Uncharacterized protein OBRU01_16370 [Operophtera brumata]